MIALRERRGTVFDGLMPAPSPCPQLSTTVIFSTGGGVTLVDTVSIATVWTGSLVWFALCTFRKMTAAMAATSRLAATTVFEILFCSWDALLLFIVAQDRVAVRSRLVASKFWATNSRFSCRARMSEAIAIPD